MPDLKFEDVSITYRTSKSDRGEVRAVKSVTLELAAGGTLGIAGESGSGKSTLAMSVLRLLPKNARLEGRILIDGADVAPLKFGELRALRWAHASIVFQGAMHSLNPVHTVGAQITEALAIHVTDRWKTPQARKARVHELLDIVDLPVQKADSYPHELSGGQKQRIMIAMALACEPEIIIADEPTTALDATVQRRVLKSLDESVSQLDTALLLITHDLAVVAGLCDRVYVMYRGEIVESGSTDQIFYEPQHAYTKELLRCVTSLSDSTPDLYVGDYASRR